MKHLLITLVLFASTLLHAQEYAYPDFGNPRMDDYAMKSCSFDKKADAVYLKKEARIMPDDDYSMISVHRVRLKILKEAGINYANVRIPYYHSGGYEFIKDIKGFVFNGSGAALTKKELSQKDIYRKKISEYYSNVIFTMPDVHEGSIIEYTYTSVRKNYRPIDYWYFQEEIPVIESNFHYVVVPTAEFNYRVLKNDGFQCEVKNDAQEGSVSFNMKNLPGIQDEAFMDSRRDYLQRVELQLAFVNSRGYKDKFVSNWQEAVKELTESDGFGKAIRNFSAADADVKASMLFSDPAQRMTYLYGIVKSRMNWDGYSGIYSSDKLKKFWDLKTGSVAEINLILTSMLKSAGLNATPMLVSEREHGKVDVKNAYLNQFNKVIAYVEIGQKSYYLDATDAMDNTKLIPENLLNTEGFLVDKKKPAFITVGDDLHLDKKILNISGKLNSSGLLQGNASISEYDYSRADSKARINHDKEGFVSSKYIKPYKDNDISVDSFYVENMDADSLALNQKLNFRLLIKPNGNYLLLNPGLFSGMEKNPFIADQRYTDVNFGSKKAYSIHLNYDLDKDLSIEALPKNVTLINPEKTIQYKRIMELKNDGKRISALIRIEILKPTFNVDEYPALKEFYKKMYSFFDEPILVKFNPTASK